MGLTLETVVFYFLAVFIIAMSILTVSVSCVRPLTCCSCFSAQQVSTFC